MKKTITWLLIASFLLTFLASCNTRQPEESKDDTASTTEQTENNPSNDISNEEKYKPVLDIYKDVIINLDEQMNSKGNPYSEGTKEYEWWAAIIGAVSTFHLSTNIPGYAFCDLNKNENDEMLLLLDDYTVLAIFSFADGKPILLDNYWNRKKCAIDGDGTIQVYGSSGADTSSFSIFKISDDDKELLLLEEYGTDGHDPETLHPRYYKISNGNKTPITVLEYAAALSQGVLPHIEFLAEHTRENADFEFIPLRLEISYKRIFERILDYDSKITSANKYLWELYFSFGNGSIASLDSVEMCYLDMDGDGVAELLLRSDIGDHIILRYHEGSVYFYEFSYKEMGRVYEDGSYSWSSPTYLEDYSHQYGISM
ncbi:MAG: hypothetical protein IKC26_03940 [Clostridia bacterium]|nr:hypothetical protein [Clostridia bacterium]